ncbi:MAG: class I SAM-dependent methyltransferase [Chloroflexia bacterium]
MPSLVDLRVLVLTGAARNVATQATLDLLEQRTTTDTLLSDSGLRTMLRVGKRLLLGRDDLILLLGVSTWLRLLVTLGGRLRRRPVLAVRRLTAQRGGERLLHVVARAAGRPLAAAGRRPLRLDVGCGSQVRRGFVGIDARRTVATAIVADARAIAVEDGVADEVYAGCLLEHFDDPHQVLREIHRVLRPDGQAVLRLPNLGTYSSHLDTTHRFLADLALWRHILGGYFVEVRVEPVGTKYRDNPWLVRVNWVLVNLLGWYELAQGWDFICSRRKAKPTIEYIGWWEE